MAVDKCWMLLWNTLYQDAIKMGIKFSMKHFFYFPLVFWVLATSAQDTTKIRHIDHLVSLINTGNFRLRVDSIIQDLPDIGLKTQTYLTAVLDSGNLKKYVNYVVNTTKQNNVFKEMITSSSFYFDSNKLIKVEEFGGQGDKRVSFEWYYNNDKPLFWTSQNEKATARAELLLTISKEIQKKVNNEN